MADEAERTASRMEGAVTALFPGFGPLLQLRHTFRVPLRRGDLAWSASAGALLVAELTHQSFPWLALYVLAAWGIARASAPYTSMRGYARWFAAGMTALAAVGLTWTWLRSLDRMTIPTISGEPNTTAAVLVLLVAVATSRPSSGRASWIVLFVGSALVLATGSRTGLVGLALLFFIVALRKRGWRRKVVTVGATAAISTTLLSLLFPALLPVQRVVPLSLFDRSANMLSASERLDDAEIWQAQGVKTSRVVETSFPSQWSLTKTASPDWARIQQPINLIPRNAYTLSAEIRADQPDVVPGWLLYRGASTEPIELRIFRQHGTWNSQARGSVDVSRVQVISTLDEWDRVEATFTYVGDDVVTAHVGFAPDLRSGATGTRTMIRALQLELASNASTYDPTYFAASGGGEARSRPRIWGTAISGIRESPIIGQGSRAFPDFAAHRRDWGTLPAHAHNEPLQVIFAFGLLGLLAYAGLWLALIWSRIPLEVLAPLFVMNLTDATLFLLPTLLVVASSATEAALGEVDLQPE